MRTNFTALDFFVLIVYLAGRQRRLCSAATRRTPKTTS